MSPLLSLWFGLAMALSPLDASPQDASPQDASPQSPSPPDSSADGEAAVAQENVGDTTPDTSLAPPETAVSTPASFLDEADEKMKQLRPQEALEIIDQRRQEGGLSRTATLRAWAARARYLSHLGEGQEAEAAYRVVLRIDPEWVPDEDIGAAAADPFRAAQLTLPEAGAGLAFAARWRQVGGTWGVEVEVAADDLNLVRGAGLVGTAIVTPLSTAAPLVFFPRPDSNRAKPPTVAVLDAESNTIAVIAPAAEANDEVRWLMLAGASTTVIGLVGAAAFAITYTSVMSDPNVTYGPWLLVGVGVATGAAGLGAALVITDEILLREE